MFPLIHHLLQPNFLLQIYIVDLVRCLTNVLFFDIPLLCCYSILNSSIICCLLSGDMYLSVGTSNLSSLCERNSSKLNFLEDFFEHHSVEKLVILSSVLLPIKSPVASTLF